jgi:hypothetical protein
VLAVAQVCCVVLHCKELSHWEGQHTKVVWLYTPGDNNKNHSKTGRAMQLSADGYVHASGLAGYPWG